MGVEKQQTEWEKLHPWKQWELHVGTRERLNELCQDLIPFIESLMSEFYFNRYSGPSDAFLKLGLLNPSVALQEKILSKARSCGAEVKESTPDLRDMEGMVIDDIKKLSTQTALHLLGPKMTMNQSTYFLHFLMNALGYMYDEELDVYLNAMFSVRFLRRG